LKLEELYCLEERKQGLEMRALCRRVCFQSMLQGLFFRSHRKKKKKKGHWCWDCPVPWEHPHL